MPQYSTTIDQARRSELKTASTAERNALVGSRYLLLKNADRLSERQGARLDELLAINTPLNAFYSLKEQLQHPWGQRARFTTMGQGRDAWRERAEATGLAPMKRFAVMLRRHRESLCNYAELPITTARLEGGHVANGLV